MAVVSGHRAWAVPRGGGASRHAFDDRSAGPRLARTDSYVCRSPILIPPCRTVNNFRKHFGNHAWVGWTSGTFHRSKWRGVGRVGQASICRYRTRKSGAMHGLGIPKVSDCFGSAVPRCRGAAARPAGDPCTDTSGRMVRSGAPAVTGRCGPPHRSPIRSRGPAGRAVPRGGCMPRRRSGPGPCGRQCVRSVAVCRFGQHADDELGYRVDLPPCRGQPLGKSEGVQPAGVVRAVRSVCEHHLRGAGRDRCRSSTFSTSSDRQDCTRGSRRAAVQPVHSAMPSSTPWT